MNRFLSAYTFNDVKLKVKSFVEKHKGTAIALYLEAVIEPDASKAVENYKQLLNQFPNSEQAENALFRTAQYYFSRGLYMSARKHFLDFRERFPKSTFADDAHYLAAACLFASEKFENCRSELKNLMHNYPRSPFTKLAREDLKEIKWLQKEGTSYSIDQIEKSKGKYTLQTGAFTQINNALNQRRYFSRLGLPVEIREKNENGMTFYLVWIGAFKTKSDAAAYGEKFKSKYGKLYRIIERF
ncbi:MAG: SPOR domain-containing protein [bacterium]